MSEANTNLFREVYAPEDYIFFEGDLEGHFYIVEKGRVSIFTKDSMGVRHDLSIIEPGESFGEFALLDGPLRHKP